jgi:DNA-binding MarR family transcriptional regulator
VPTWSFLTNHARVLLCIAQDSGVRLREIGDRVGITERAAHRIVDELVDAGYISRTRIAAATTTRFTEHGRSRTASFTNRAWATSSRFSPRVGRE